MARGLALAIAAIALAGCGGGTGMFSTSEPAAKSTMAGRWMLESPRAPGCGVEMTASPDDRTGRIIPEGGCPGGFYRARRWALEGGALTIRDDNGDAVGQFSQAGDRFDGKSASGITLTLTRPAPPPTE